MKGFIKDFCHCIELVEIFFINKNIAVNIARKRL